MSASREKSYGESLECSTPQQQKQGLFFLYDRTDQAHLSQNGDILLKCTLQTYSCFPASFQATGKKMHLLDLVAIYVKGVRRKVSWRRKFVVNKECNFQSLLQFYSTQPFNAQPSYNPGISDTLELCESCV